MRASCAWVPAGFAERARRELEAAGVATPRVAAENWLVLTPQELQMARLASDGRTNPEIGAQLYISPRTVEYHLPRCSRSWI
jgi:DNA-binding CsgD family transcriptional regulator